MGDRLRSWLRTVVPGVWAALLGWLASLGAPDVVLDALGGVPGQALVLVALAVVYPLARWVEERLPRWARRLLLGGSTSPTYGATRAGG